MKTLEDLHEQYPELLKNHGYSSYMPDGWMPMFSKLCDDIHAAAVKHGIQKGAKGYPHIDQYKEKFSELRIYFKCSNDVLREEIRPLIEKACKESVTICSECGGPANKIHGEVTGYYRNFCDPCEKAYLKRQKR